LESDVTLSVLPTTQEGSSNHSPN